MASVWAAFTTFQPPNIKSNDDSAQSQQQQLLVFGYRSKILHRTEDTAANAEQAGLLSIREINSLKTDRFDCRLHFHRPELLDEIAAEASKSSSLQCNSHRMQPPREDALDELRYASLDHEHEKSVFDAAAVENDRAESGFPPNLSSISEEVKTTQVPKSSVSNFYGAVPFAYAAVTTDDGNSAIIGQSVAPYSKPPSLELPPHIALPKSQQEHEVIVRTAKFTIERGAQFEIFLKLKQTDNPTFGFLQTTHALNAYYKTILVQIRAGRYLGADLEEATATTTTVADVPETSSTTTAAAVAAAAGDDSDSDDDDDDGYLHPALLATTAPKAVTVPSTAETTIAEETVINKPKLVSEAFIAADAAVIPAAIENQPANDSALGQLAQRVRHVHDQVSAKFGITEPQPPANMVPPPPSSQNIIDMVATNVAVHGAQLEQNILRQYADDAGFAFIRADHYLYPYYEFKKLKARFELERNRRDVQEAKLAQLRAAVVEQEKSSAAAAAAAAVKQQQKAEEAEKQKILDTESKVIRTPKIIPFAKLDKNGRKIKISFTMKNLNNSSTNAATEAVSIDSGDAETERQQKARREKAQAFLNDEQQKRSSSPTAAVAADDDNFVEGKEASGWQHVEKAEIGQIIDSLRDFKKQNSCLVEGKRTVGKTNAYYTFAATTENVNVSEVENDIRPKKLIPNAVDSEQCCSPTIAQTAASSVPISKQQKRSSSPKALKTAAADDDNNFMEGEAVGWQRVEKAEVGQLIDSLRNFRDKICPSEGRRTVGKTNAYYTFAAAAEDDIASKVENFEKLDAVNSEEPCYSPTTIALADVLIADKASTSEEKRPCTTEELRAELRHHRRRTRNLSISSSSSSSTSSNRSKYSNKRKVRRRASNGSSSSSSNDGFTPMVKKKRSRNRQRKMVKERAAVADSDDDDMSPPRSAKQDDDDGQRSRRRRRISSSGASNSSSSSSSKNSNADIGRRKNVVRRSTETDNSAKNVDVTRSSK